VTWNEECERWCIGIDSNHRHRIWLIKLIHNIRCWGPGSAEGALNVTSSRSNSKDSSRERGGLLRYSNRGSIESSIYKDRSKGSRRARTSTGKSSTNTSNSRSYRDIAAYSRNSRSNSWVSRLCRLCSCLFFLLSWSSQWSSRFSGWSWPSPKGIITQFTFSTHVILAWPSSYLYGCRQHLLCYLISWCLMGTHMILS